MLFVATLDFIAYKNNNNNKKTVFSANYHQLKIRYIYLESGELKKKRRRYIFEFWSCYLQIQIDKQEKRRKTKKNKKNVTGLLHERMNRYACEWKRKRKLFTIFCFVLFSFVYQEAFNSIVSQNSLNYWLHIS